MMGKEIERDAVDAVACCATCRRTRRCRSVPYPVVTTGADGASGLSFHLLPCCRECREQFLLDARQRLAGIPEGEVVTAWRKKYDQVESVDQVVRLIEHSVGRWSRVGSAEESTPLPLTAQQKGRLAAHGIRQARELLSMAAVPRMTRHLASLLGITEEELDRVLVELRDDFAEHELRTIAQWEPLDGRLGDLGELPGDRTWQDVVGRGDEEDHHER